MGLIYSPVDPVYRIPDIPVDGSFLVERALRKFGEFEADRVEWVSRREEYYLGWDDYISPTRKGLFSGSSNVHLPTTEIQCAQMHARILQAFFFMPEWFYVDPQEDMDMARVLKIERFMKYVLTRYCNYHEGIYNSIDDWAWDVTTDGVGILSRGWEVIQRRAVIVEENDEFRQQRVDLQKMLEDTDEKEFDQLAKKLIKQPYKEKSIIRTVFNGPTARAEDPMYVLFKGDVVDCTDLNRQQTVIKVCYFTEDELEGFKQSEFMDEEVINAVLDQEPDKKGSTLGSSRVSQVEYAKDRMTGVRTVSSSAKSDKYEFLCVYDRVAPKGKGRAAEELIYYVPTNLQKLARWTFLDRVSASGKRNMHMTHLYRRPRRSIPRGMVETQFPINEAIDLLINQSIDAGILANNPMFGYRKDSTFDPQEVRVGPGIGIPCEDPNNDIQFFSWSVNPNWSVPIQNMLQGLGSQLTSLGPLASGQIGGAVGPLRSTSGVNAMLGQTDVNLDVVIKRIKKTYGEFMDGLYQDVVDRMPEKLKISVTGMEGAPLIDEDGNPIRDEMSKEELRAKVHFGIYANAQNMNRQVMRENAMNIAQFSFQPAAMQTGVITPQNVHEILANIHSAMGTMRSERFLTKPTGGMAIPFAAEMLMIMQGLSPPIVLADPEHEMKADKMDELKDSPKAQMEVQYGIVHPNAMKILAAAAKRHRELFEMMQKPSNLENPTGSQVSPTGGQQGQPPVDSGPESAEPVSGGEETGGMMEGGEGGGEE